MNKQMEEIDKHIKEMLLSEIDKIYKAEAYLSVFTVGFTIIDYMASLIKKSDPFEKVKGDDFVEFVDNYMTGYSGKGKDIYSLRNKLLHRYCIVKDTKVEYVYSHGVGKHFAIDDSGRTILDAKQFKEDICATWENLKNKVLSNPMLFDKLCKSYSYEKSIRFVRLSVNGQSHIASGGCPSP